MSRGGIESVSALASRIGLSVRQVQRLHGDQVGLPPMLTARILRFHRVVKALGVRARESLASMAVSEGYVDQAHMTREFREFSGITPGLYRKLRHPLSDLFTAGLE